MVEGGMKCVKYLIFFFNFIFVISGIALIAMGAVIKGYYNKYLDFLGDDIISVPVLLIVVGVIIFFVAFMGCCGAIRESYCMTMTFAVLLALIFILELAAGIAAYVKRDDIKDVLNTNMQKTMMNYGNPDNKGVTKTWDGMQLEWDCCGVANFTDWAAVPEGAGGAVPDSCCHDPRDGCGAGVLYMDAEEAAGVIYTEGCVSAIIKSAHRHWVTYVIAAAVFAVIQLRCCGIADYRDWGNTDFGNATSSVPDSCCKPLSQGQEGCGNGVAGQTPEVAGATIYIDGCLDRLEEEIQKNIVAVGGAGVGIAFLQILGVILACCLGKSIKKEYETV